MAAAAPRAELTAGEHQTVGGVAYAAGRQCLRVAAPNGDCAGAGGPAGRSAEQHERADAPAPGCTHGAPAPEQYRSHDRLPSIVRRRSQRRSGQGRPEPGLLSAQANPDCMPIITSVR